jgi:hypothetical protein
MSLSERFPDIPIVIEGEKNDIRDDYNPAIRLFGKRFIKGQTILEYLAEFLLVVFSEKCLGADNFRDPFPPLEKIRGWVKGSSLKYNPPIKLNLKLLTLLSVSRMDARHAVHTTHYQKLLQRLEERNLQNVTEWLEEFFRGFQGAGFDRAWCAQTFFPISSSLLTKETIWNEIKARSSGENLTWQDTLKSEYYSTKRAFLARGGEVLYLHICNVFATSQEQISKFGEAILSIEPSCISKERELRIENLYFSIQKGFKRLYGPYTDSIDQLVDFIETLDPATQEKFNNSKYNNKSFISCQWCPRDSWQEGLLFTIEINRLLSTKLDPIERLELMMTGSALHVLRSLSSQSARYDEIKKFTTKNVLNYCWIFSSINALIRQNRIVSQRNLEVNLSLIQRVLYRSDLQEHAAKDREKKNSKESLTKEAENKYGHKLFLSLGKRLGIIAPKKGIGTRFIMTDRLLRYLVMVLIPPEGRCTYDDFLQRLYIHFGIAIEREILTDAAVWSGLVANQSIQAGNWLQEMLGAEGFLEKLSDGYSLVQNPFSKVRD